MKPETFANYIFTAQEQILEGWNSRAAFEIAVQVKLDGLIRAHLSTHVGLDDDGDHLQTKGSGASKNATTPIHKNKWPKMREERYTFEVKVESDGDFGGDKRSKKPKVSGRTKEIADFRLKNKRYTKRESGKLKISKTYYWIELKVESPDTGNFGGQSAQDAISTDTTKLRVQQDDDGGPAEDTRRRYWFVMLAFSVDGRKEILSRRKFWTVCREAMHPDGTMAVGIIEYKD